MVYRNLTVFFLQETEEQQAAEYRSFGTLMITIGFWR